MLIIHADSNTIEAILTIEPLKAVVCCSRINAEIVPRSNGVSACWILSAISSERSTMSTKITQSEMKAIPAKTPPNKCFLSKNCPAPGKTNDDNNAALIVLFILMASTNSRVKFAVIHNHLMLCFTK
jgi:hypothetical protein